MKYRTKIIVSLGILCTIILGVTLIAKGLNENRDAGFVSTTASGPSGLTMARSDLMDLEPFKPQQDSGLIRPSTANTKRFVVYFDFDSTRVSSRSQKTLRQALEFARTVKARHVDLSGFADRAGPSTYNLKLSRERAGVVAQTLKSVDIGIRQLDVKAFGEERLAVHTPDGKAHRRNRRVEIIVTA